MVVSNLRIVKHLLALLQGFATYGTNEVSIGSHTIKLYLIDTIKRLRTFLIYIISKVLGVNSGIGSNLLLIQTLDERESGLSSVGELLVALHLKRGKVEELGRFLCARLLGHTRYLKLLILYSLESLFTLFLRGKLTLRSCEESITINGGEHPVRLWFEVVYLLLTIYNHGESWSLHPANREHTCPTLASATVVAILDGIETSGIHAKKPVAYGTRETSQIEWLVFFLLFKGREALTNSLFSKRGYPQTLDRTLDTSLLHNPSLNEFTLLTSITTVYYLISLLKEFLDNSKLFLDMVLLYEFDAKA